MQQSNERATSDGTRLEVKIVGFSFSDLDRYGRLNDRKTCAITWYGVHPGFLDGKRLKEDGREYFSSFQAKLNLPLLNPQALLYKEMWMEKELIHVGNTSFVVRSVLKSPDRRGTLAEAKYVSVHVDEASRKKRELPAWFKEKYGHLKQTTAYFKPVEVPRYWCCQAKVHSSETDRNNHANFASYITYCQNAVYKHQKQQSKLEWLQSRSMEEVEISYLGDCMQGDKLTLYVLQQADPEGTFYVDIEKQGVEIVKARLKYSPSPSLSSHL